MKVLGRRVLIEQRMVKKVSAIIRVDPKSPDGLGPEESYDVSFKILQIGSDCPPNEINVGEIPIFGKHIQFNTVKIVEKTKDLVVINAIVSYDDIEGIDDAPVVDKKMLN